MTRIVLGLMLTIALGAAPVGSDGLMVPAAADYPKELLRHRMTRVEVALDGVVARTSVYQEFVNEAEQPTDAVYSFPLPEGARATLLVYWAGGQAYRAVLEEKPQSSTPGTGEGGTAARVNQYLGGNGITLRLRDIGPGQLQQVRLDYLELCDFHQGTCRYRYPLASGGLVTHPIDQLDVVVTVQSTTPIVDFTMLTHPDHQVRSREARAVTVEMSRPQAYLDADLEFTYTTTRGELGADFYSVAGDSAAGHFALVVRPPDQADAAAALPKRVFFLLATSARAYGSLLASNVAAISRALDLLSPQDVFNILLVSNSIDTHSPPFDGCG